MVSDGGKVRLTVSVTVTERDYLNAAAEARRVSVAYIVREAVRLHMDFYSTRRDSTLPHILDDDGA